MSGSNTTNHTFRKNRTVAPRKGTRNCNKVLPAQFSSSPETPQPAAKLGTNGVCVGSQTEPGPLEEIDAQAGRGGFSKTGACVPGSPGMQDDTAVGQKLQCTGSLTPQKTRGEGGTASH